MEDRDLRIARFWDMGPGTFTPPGYWLNDVAVEELRTIEAADQATALALTATTLFDAGIATWDSKYAYDLIRPVTVIQQSEPAWLPSIVTPAFPAYVSGHAVFSTTAAEVLAALFPASADEFLDAAAEAADSRVSGGIHYWFDASEGVTMGEQVATQALERAGLEPAEAERVGERLVYSGPEART